ncbi:MAG: hypothetical protein ABJG68_07190 [Crocinitomicaceae bacterium]
MDTQQELNQKILQTITKIRNEHPELVKYLTEMPVVHSDDEDVNKKALKDYHDSLIKLLAGYKEKHN